MSFDLLLVRAIIAALLLLLSAPAVADDDHGAGDAVIDSKTVRYGADFFAPFQPVTLGDMIRNVPGGVTVLSDIERSARRGRGFGSSGAQILLNGKRMPGKANDMGKTLARIQAAQVKYIDLIRGTSEGLDIRSEGILFNVVLKEGADSEASTFMEATLKYVPSLKPTPALLLAHNAGAGSFKYGVSYQLKNRNEVHSIPEDVLNADGSPREFRALHKVRGERTHLVTGMVSYTFGNGDVLSLNGLYSDNRDSRVSLEDQFLAGSGGGGDPFAIEDKDWLFSDTKWEIGADYETDLGILGALKALIILNRVHYKETGVEDLIEDDIRNRTFTYAADYPQQERIFRASLTKALGTAHTLEYGIEGAFNRLDKTTTIDADPATNTRVSEDRYEIFATHSWTLTPKLSLQSSLIEEFSAISQISDAVNTSRSFNYLKPRVELRFDLTPRDQLRLVADKTVSQLDLNGFIVSRNYEDDTIDAGNPNLEPYKLWTWSLSFERQLANNAGSLEAKLFYEDYSDYIDKIEIGAGSSGVGNIGDAWRYGLQLTGNVRLGFIGVPNALLTMNYTYRDSQATDPFTGETRPLRRTSRHRWNVDFRHDVTALNLTYGFNVNFRSRTIRDDISLHEFRFNKRHVRLFADYKISPRMKLHFEFNHPLKDLKMWDKTIYDGHISAGLIDRIERRTEKAKPDFVLSLQVTF